MLLKYAGIEFQVEKINAYNQRFVYGDDGHTYLYTHHFLDVTCIFNPSATATTDNSSDYGPVTRTQFQDRGNKAVLSIDQLKQRLSQPSQQLLVKIYHNDQDGVDAWPPEDVSPVQPAPRPVDINGRSVLLIESPQAISADGGNTFIRMPCDARGGPNPISFDVIEFHGEKTAVCRFVIETWINENPGIPNFLLYHRWEMTHDIDEHFYTTRTISGEAIFRRDWLDNAFTPQGALDPQKPYVPDYFRRAFFHPVPVNFKRMPVQITALEDGNSIRYQLVDKEQTLNIYPALGLTKIEGTYRRKFEFSGFVLPKQYCSVNVRAWGNRGVTRQSLVNAVFTMAETWGAKVSFNFKQNFSFLIQNFSQFDLEVDMVDRFAELTVEVFSSGLSGVTAQMFWPKDQGPKAGAPNNNWPESMAGIAMFDDSPGYGLPSNTGTHGTYLGRCVAAALQTPGFAAMPIPIIQPTDLEVPNIDTDPPTAP